MFDSIDSVRSFLTAVKERDHSQSTASAAEAIREIKKRAVSDGDDQKAKELWCLEETLKAQSTYVQAFGCIRHGDYYRGWCALEQAEITLHHMRQHFHQQWPDYSLDFVEKHIERWQSVYPYKYFISPEILAHEKECTVCNRKMAIRNHCGHIVGEIYGGEIALRRITNGDVLGIAIMVEKPVQKYSVLFLTDSETGSRADKYNYAVVEFVARRVCVFLGEWI